MRGSALKVDQIERETERESERYGADAHLRSSCMEQNRSRIGKAGSARTRTEEGERAGYARIVSGSMKRERESGEDREETSSRPNSEKRRT